ncbi:MAG: LamG domain-containing protein, partial [Elusimicrobiota bacterium]
MSLKDGLISYWELEETSGDVIDSHGDNDGTNNGATRGVSGKIGNAYDFDGSDDEIDTTFDAGGQDEITVSAWIYPKSLTSDGWNYVISQEGDVGDRAFILRIEDDNYIEWGINNNYITSNTQLETDKWYHLLVTYDGSYTKIYIDGSEDKSDSLSDGSLETSPQKTVIGNGDYYTKRHFDGKIDEVGIWDRALSSSEISDLYNNGDGLAYDDFDG